MRPLVLSLLGLFVFLIVACAPNTQGQSCEGEGSTDDCDTRLVCGHHDKTGGLTCLKQCSVDGDCLSAEICKVIKGTVKGCVSEQL